MLQRVIYFIKYPALLILVMLSFFAQAQNVEQLSDETALGHLRALEKGCVVVVLRTSYKRIANIDDALNNKDLSKKRKRYLTKDKSKTIEEDGNYNEALSSAFQTNYTYSNFAFTTDQNLDNWLNGSDSTLHIVNAQLEELNDHPCTQNENRYIIRDGYTQGDMKFYALIFYDANYNALARPFPYYINLSNAGPISLVNGFFGKTDYRNFPQMIDRMEEKLIKQAEKLAKH